MKEILLHSHRLLQNTSLEFIRAEYSSIAWDQRLVGIIGPRGIGKTTLLLQHLKNNNSATAIYFSADHFSIIEKGIYSAIEFLYLEEGKKTFYIDEIHKSKDWNQALKNIYDAFPDIQIYFSGSSSIDLMKGSYDLSRRALLYYLQGLSFREYIEYTKKITLPVFSLAEICTPHSPPAQEIYNILGDEIPYLFRQYLEHGYYPFSFEGSEPEIFSEKLFNALEKVFYEDISSYYSLNTQNIEKIKKIFLLYSLAKPGDLSINSLQNKVSLSYDTVAQYVQILYETGLINSVFSEGGVSKLIRKSKKLFIDNTNILSMIEYKTGKKAELGTIREVFFLNQVQKKNTVFWSKDADFLCEAGEKSITIEIGGKSKTSKQIKEIKNSFVVQDNTLIPSQRTIPLWIFGFLY